MNIKIYNYKTLLSEVIYNSDDDITVKVHDKTSIFQPFTEGKINKNTLYEFLHDRCFEENRPDLNELLTALELSEYDPLKIVKKTHGIILSDFTWLKFDNENIEWEDFNELYQHR